MLDLVVAAHSPESVPDDTMWRSQRTLTFAGGSVLGPAVLT
jgi:hypothetical protein